MASEGEDPDLALLEGVGRGEQAAVRRLLDARLPRILALARRLLADPDEAQDVAQETFLRAWKQAPSWRPGQARFDTWLHRVALNLCYDRLRRRREIVTDTPPEQADTGPAPDARLLHADLSRRVDAALAALPARQREAIVLTQLIGLAYADAADVAGCPVGTIRSRVARGRDAIAEALGQASRREA